MWPGRHRPMLRMQTRLLLRGEQQDLHLICKREQRFACSPDFSLLFKQLWPDSSSRNCLQAMHSLLLFLRLGHTVRPVLTRLHVQAIRQHLRHRPGLHGSTKQRITDSTVSIRFELIQHVHWLPEQLQRVSEFLYLRRLPIWMGLYWRGD